MSEYVLRPSKIVAYRIVPIEGSEPLRLTLKEMFARFAPSGEKAAKTPVAYLRAGQYIGLVKDEAGVVRNFTITIRSRDNKVDWLLRKQPDLSERIVELYEVETARRDARILNEQSSDTHGGA